MGMIRTPIVRHKDQLHEVLICLNFFSFLHVLQPSATVGLKCRRARTTMRTGSKAGDWRVFEP